MGIYKAVDLSKVLNRSNFLQETYDEDGYIRSLSLL